MRVLEILMTTINTTVFQININLSNHLINLIIMRKLLVFIFFTVSIISYSQIGPYDTFTPSTYTPMSPSEILGPAMMMQKRYDANQKYLYGLKEWILELKPQISEQKFINQLNEVYNYLTSLEDGDLANATKQLRQVENAINEFISNYNIWVNEQNAKNKNASSTTTDFVSIGIQHMQDGEYALAVRSFSKFLEEDGSNTDIIFYRAMAKHNLGDFHGSISDYDKVIELNSNYPMEFNEVGMAYNNKAYAYVKLKEYNKALIFVEKALELDKSAWHFWDTRGEIYLNLGSYDKCISDLNRALEIHENSNSYFLRGLAFIKSGQKVMGCKDLSKAGELGKTKAYDEIVKNCN